MKTNSLVLSALLQAGDSTASAIKCFKGVCISSQHPTSQIPGENVKV